MLLSAVFFDVDGTIAETEELHRRSFNESFKEFNLDWFWDKPIYKELINIGGGKERIEFYNKSFLSHSKQLCRKDIEEIHPYSIKILDFFFKIKEISVAISDLPLPDSPATHIAFFDLS